MAKQECVMLFPEVEGITKRLTDEQFGALIRAIIGYQLRAEEYTGDDPAVDMAFQFLSNQHDRAIAYKEQKSQAARSRWDKQKKSDSMQSNADTCTPMQGDAPEENGGGSPPLNPPEKPKKVVFKPPTLEEVTEYCHSRGKGVDPEKWYNHYTANGWMVGRNKMKDWKAAVRTWEAKIQPAPQISAQKMPKGGNQFLDMLKKGGCL